MAFSFDQVFAADPANPQNVASNAAILIYAPGDTTKTPLTITDPSGGALANPVIVNANGFGSAFMHATLDRVAWDGGGFSGFFTSYEGMKQVAVAAQEAAETAGADAGAVAASAVASVVADAANAQAAAAASATAAANSAALVGAPADSAMAAAVNGTGATNSALYGMILGVGHGNFAKVYAVDPGLGNDSTEASTGIQAALDAANAAGGGTVFIPDGTYRVGTTLRIGSNTHLQMSKRATIKRNSATDALLLNKSDGTTGAYGQARNIRISGGTFDGNAATWTGNCTMVSFGHTDGVVIEGVTLKNLSGSWHEIELNAVRGGRILNCRFLDRLNGGTSNAEMVQLDQMYGSSGFPWFGPYDYTPCVDILIQGNEFRNGVNGIGNHASFLDQPVHRDIRVIGNHFEDMIDSALRFQAYQNIIIESNTARECTRFIWITQGFVTFAGIIIRGNILTNIVKQDINEGRGIQIIAGSGVGDRKLSGIVIDSNVLVGMGRFGITLNYTNGAIVTGNRITGTGANISGTALSSAALWVYRSANTRIIGNSFSNTAPAGTNVETADVIIGTTGGAASDTPNTILADNQIEKLKVNTVNVAIIHDNNVSASRTLGSGVTQTDLREHDNMVAGAWTL